MAKMLADIPAGFDLIDQGWQPITVSDLKWAPVKSGLNAGQARLGLELAVSGGPFEGRKLFEGANFFGNSARYARIKLTTLAPDIDWGDWEFPDDFEDVEGVERLKEALLGREGYALVEHVPSRQDATQLTENVKRLSSADSDPPLAYEGTTSLF